MKVKFFGAAGTVTGSMHMVELPEFRFLVDAGYFQGHLFELNHEPLREVKDVPYLFLTHAHLDHIGRLPMLVREGFRGKVITHRATWEIGRYILEDAFHLMDEDDRLYDLEDLRRTFALPVSFVECGEEYSIGNLKFRVRDAGHILGSAFYEYEYGGKRFTFSGDLGNTNKPIVRDPQMPNPADVVFMESTYGDRNHKPFEESVEELKEAVFSTLPRGKVLIPAFALERAQELLYVFKTWENEGIWPGEWKVVLDSPLATKILTEFLKFPECYDEEAYERFLHENPFKLRNLIITRTKEESKRINHVRTGTVIIAGSGMLTGGRAIHHLKHMIEDPNNAVVFVGYQAEGTLGREIVDGAEKVWISNRFYDVNIRVFTINGFSSHAGRDELLDWATAANPREVVLLHGEERAKESLKRAIEDRLGSRVHMPTLYDEIEI
ncbi:MAG: MBL fold metallo-hydrolase [Thermotogae bacterium]|nr:MBL fold metallo-hydrolase [Thermotogota bacterium]